MLIVQISLGFSIKLRLESWIGREIIYYILGEIIYYSITKELLEWQASNESFVMESLFKIFINSKTVPTIPHINIVSVTRVLNLIRKYRQGNGILVDLLKWVNARILNISEVLKLKDIILILMLKVKDVRRIKDAYFMFTTLELIKIHLTIL